jgi:hypothetical protein
MRGEGNGGAEVQAKWRVWVGGRGRDERGIVSNGDVWTTLLAADQY